MNKKKLQALSKIETHVGLHTGNGTTDWIIDLEKANNNNLVRSCNIRKVRNEDCIETYVRINPNRNNYGYILTSYSEFQNVIQKLFYDIGVTDFEWKRMDLSFNTMKNDFYANYTKLNRLLIACFASSTNDCNTYDTRNFWNGKEKSLATKNGYREIEFYDKQDESRNKSPYYSRLELRSLRMSNDIPTEFMKIWFDRLDKAVKEFEAVQDRFNYNMAELYLKDKQKPKHDREFLSVNSFLMTRKDYIFTSTQMKKLLMLIGFDEKTARNKTYNFKKHHRIEYFKKSYLETMVADIKSKIIKYFSE